MGNLFYRPKQQTKILMQGLDAAGKTTILYKLKLGEVVTTIPTIGFNVETVELSDIKFTVWDVGGRDKIRPLWRQYYPDTNAVIFVVDSNDRERMSSTDDYPTANSELQNLLAEEKLRGIPLLVFANKQDLPQALSVADITAALELNKIKDRQWYVQPAIATKGDGLHEGIQWLSSVLSKSNSNSKPKSEAKKIEASSETGTSKQEPASTSNDVIKQQPVQPTTVTAQPEKQVDTIVSNQIVEEGATV